jgi:hypothetical protein
MKNITITMDNKTDEHVYVWKVGKGNGKNQGYPRTHFKAVFAVKLIYGKTAGCMS